MLWSLPLCLYHPTVQTPSIFFIHSLLFSLSTRILLWKPFPLIFNYVGVCSFVHYFLQFFLPTFPPPFLLLCNLSIPPHCRRSVFVFDSSFGPFQPLEPIFPFPLCTHFLIASLSFAHLSPLSSIFPSSCM